MHCLVCDGAGCARCEWGGWICPVCRGARVIRHHTCPGCCEGNQVSLTREWRTIEAYQLAQLRKERMRRAQGGAA